MKLYEATVIDKCAGAEPASYESYVAVGKDMEWYINQELKEK